MKAITPDQQYLSTRQSAKILQVSLGTVQKMVELGELIAWKTRGGHRRILTSSLNQQLRRRKLCMQERASQHQYLVLGIFKRHENLESMQKIMSAWSIQLELIGSMDSLEGLMQAVSLYPDVIYLDSLIPPVEQLHLIHYLSKNIQTRRIPLLLDESFVQLHPGVLEMAKENTIAIKTLGAGEATLSKELDLLPEKPNLLTYTNCEDQTENEDHQPLESIFIKALNDLM